ncbi:Signal transduction histidine kinase [Pseudarcicella hirudinis]|uniref:Signal transduction histidine kinase n=2 Tax=Pseudarcicella hirudinis TaxID=1079859 RepID=A0A1I5QHC8_9BACT|nr:Signal transduction histidine kinase [Pseudarcicella hirudinis]
MILLGNSSVFAQRKIVINSSDHPFVIGRQIEVFEDKSALLDLKGVQAPGNDARFTQSIQINPNFGVTNSVVWSRFKLVNNTSDKLYLEIGEPVMDSITIYKIDSSNKISITKAGVYLPSNERDLHTNFYLIDLKLQPNEYATYYMRLQNSQPIIFPLRVAALPVFFEDNHPKDLLQGFYLGLMIVMAIFNFFIFWTVRSREYLYYVLYVLSFAGFFAHNKGISQEFIWGQAVWVNRFSPLFLAFTMIFGLLFAESFLNAPRYIPVTRRITRGFIILIALFLFFNIIGLGAESTKFLNLTSFFAVFYILVVAILIWLEGSLYALFFLIAWSTMLISAMIFILQLSNALPSDYFTRNALQVGSGLEVVLLSFGLAYRINAYRQETENAQNEVIKQLQENEQIRNRIARDLHDDIGSTLSSIGILSQVAENQVLNSPVSVKDLLKKITDSSQKVQRSLSDIVWTTRHTSDNFSELLVKMREFIAELFEPKYIHYDFKADDLPDIKLSPTKQYHLYLIFKEAINNIVKYADASEVKIEFFVKDNHLLMTICDDGKGFDEKTVKQGNGLGNMKKRAEQMTGKLTVTSKPDCGTSINFSIPLIL